MKEIYIWHSNTDKIVNASNIWANFFYVFNHATILSNGMPIYGQTVLYIWSKLSMLNECAKCFQMYGQTFLCAKYSQIYGQTCMKTLCVQPCKYIVELYNVFIHVCPYICEYFAHKKSLPIPLKALCT